MAKTIIDSYNELVPAMNKLAKENKDIWEYHNSTQGYGFKVIEKDFYIETRVATDFGDEESSFLIVKNKRNGNIFSCMDKELGRIETHDPSKIYEYIKSLYQ